MNKLTIKLESEHRKVTTVIKEAPIFTLNSMLQVFEEALKGCGFNFDGHLDIVEDE